MAQLYEQFSHLSKSSYKGPGNLDLALRSFDLTYDKFPRNADSQLLDCITAAEAMLSGDGTSELTFRLSFRTAGMLGRTVEERKMIFQAMKVFYDARSKTVHGATLSSKQQNALAKIGEAREIIRRLLRAFVRMAEMPSASYDAKFIAERLDYILQDEQARRRMMKELGVIS